LVQAQNHVGPADKFGLDEAVGFNPASTRLRLFLGQTFLLAAQVVKHVLGLLTILPNKRVVVDCPFKLADSPY
jgi:hypothetical protein